MTGAELYQKLQNVDTGACSYTVERCEEWAPLVTEIQEMKARLNAVILVHTYVNPEIVYGVADYVGDSYYLSNMAKQSDADIIIFVAVEFMAETAKILNPSKRVFQTSSNGGCSLASSINGKEVAKLRRENPDHTFMCYINTTADVKAECDVCVTSSNVYDIVENLDNDKIYFLPDRLMAQNIIAHLKNIGLDKEVLYTDGSCYVHETYDPEMIDYLRLKHPKVSVAVHPECAPSVTGKADYVGSTSGIFNHVVESDHDAYVLVTECGLSSRLRVEYPDKKIVGSCTFCGYMQSNSLETVLETMKTLDPKREILIDPMVVDGARRCIERMFEEVEKSQPSI
jgi:quinolinate synthase